MTTIVTVPSFKSFDQGFSFCGASNIHTHTYTPWQSDRNNRDAAIRRRCVTKPNLMAKRHGTWYSAA